MHGEKLLRLQYGEHGWNQVRGKKSILRWSEPSMQEMMAARMVLWQWNWGQMDLLSHLRNKITTFQRFSDRFVVWRGEVPMTFITRKKLINDVF